METEAVKYLKKYASKIKVYQKACFKVWLRKAFKLDPVAGQALTVLQNYMTGGKSLRGVLTILGYQIAGGRNLKKILPAALAVELMHNALLIQDDFIDRDKFRRGKPTVHEVYQNNKIKDEHYGASMAVVVADLAIFLANKLLADLSFSRERLSRAISELNRFLINTAFGELMDIDFDRRAEISRREILKVRLYKTAHYTFAMPLVAGAILAGGNSKLTNKLTDYGEAVGLAYQLRDDVLGIFGDPKSTGKSNDSDIKVGKKTLLYLKAVALTKGEAKRFLKRNYGAERLTPAKIERIRRLMETSGARSYSEKKAAELAGKGNKLVTFRVLHSLADYAVFRER